MDYEKKYKEALEVAKRKLCFDKAGMVDSFTPSDIYEMFPELKESNDERIRKVLIDYFKRYKEQEECGIKTFYGIPADDILAWLEKQKEYESTDFEYVWDRTDCGELTSALDKYSEEAIINMCHAWYDKGIELERKSWLEKQGEHRQDPCDNCDNVMLNCHNFPCIKKKAFEQGKSVFDVINEEKVDNQFCVKPVDKVEPKFKVKYAGSEYNVLEVKDIAGVTFYGIEDEPNHIDYIKAENCERVEDEIEIPYGSKDSELQEATYYIPKGFYAEIDDDKVVIKKGEKPTEWSEEDENIKEWIMSDINKLLALNRKSFVIADKEITWLKSLKGRVGCEVNCTTTKKWSEEDIATISRVISIVKWAAYSDHSHPILNDEGATELVERLKSLKERYTWKPSDEQMDALLYVCRNLNPPLSDKLGWDSLKTMELLYKILKKLY